MNINEADEICAEYEYWDDMSCNCPCGNPPCAKCESQPSKEVYEEACLIIKQHEKESTLMNKIIIEMYPTTKDAVLVQKWFGEKITNEPLIGMLLRGKETDLLEEAKRLEEEQHNQSLKMTS